MIGIRYYKADPSTFVIKTSNGKATNKGRGLSFFYNGATTSIAAIPVNAQEAPFIFNLQTADFQEVRIQGQVSYRIEEPEVIAEMMNFNLKTDGRSYVSEDPMKLSDQVIREVQAIIQREIQEVMLRNALSMSQSLVNLIKKDIGKASPLNSLGIRLLNIGISAITPSPETARALEAEAREQMLGEADDAIYARRKSAVEQERTIKEAELQTELFVQEKEQEIEESRVGNERTILRQKAETEQEQIQAEIDAENKRKELVSLAAQNLKKEADTEAYSISAKMKAYATLPVDNLKAMALSNMGPEQLMAMGFESLAENSAKIGELNISPDLFGQMFNKAIRK